MASERRSKRVLEGLGELPSPFARVKHGDQDGDPVDPAYTQGVEDGFERARQELGHEVERHVADLRAEVSSALESLGELHERVVREHQSLMIELALQSASRIVRDRIAGDDPIAARALREASNAIPQGEILRARLHPDDVESIERELDDEISSARLSLVADEGVTRGGCVLESASGTVEATLEVAEESVRNAAEGKP